MPGIDFDNQSKVQILLHALEERYKAQHTIRERVQNVCLWTLGLFLAAGGWLIQSGIVLNLLQKWLYTVFIVVAILVLRLLFLRDLDLGFKSQQKIAADIEEKLGFYNKGFFGTSAETLYPASWRNAGNTTGKGRFINSNYVLLYTGALFLLVIIWVSGCFK